MTSALRALLLGGLLVAPAFAQLSTGGRPASESAAWLPSAPTITLPATDAAALLREDALRGRVGPLRFGTETDFGVGLAETGRWDVLQSGERIWRLRIAAPGAVSLSAVLSSFRLPEGAELFVYDDLHEHVLGAYTAENNKDSGRFAFQPLPADAITLEYREPAHAAFAGELVIARVISGYRPLPGPPEASACYVDVKCPEAAGWQNQVRAAVMLVIGSSVCSGSFLNTTARNGQQLLMTADHCGDLDDAVFVFKYQNSLCGGGTASLAKTVQGSKRLAGSATGDYQLVCVKERIPGSYGVYYAGWDRGGVAPTGTTSIHHPLGKPKCISQDFEAPGRQNEFWHVAAWDVGVTEQGSSGSPLYGNAGFIGQLHGGTATCGNPIDDFYGALDSYWAGVEEFLDPLGTGQTTLQGFDPSGNGPDEVVGVYDVHGTLVMKAALQKEIIPVMDTFTFFPDKSFTLLNGEGTWSKKTSGNKTVYSVDVKDSFQELLNQSLPTGAKAKVNKFKFINGKFNAQGNKLGLTPDGDVTIKYQGKTIQATVSGKLVAKKPCGCT